MSQAQIEADWPNLEDRVKEKARKAYWHARLAQGHWVPTRELQEIAVEEIAKIKEWHQSWPEDQRPSFPWYQAACLAERWLAANRLRILKLIEDDERR